MDWLSLITALIGAVAGGGGVGLFFWRQNRAAKVIQNESALSIEWEKLYREQKAEREANDAEIEELKKRVFDLEAKVSQLEIENEKLKTKGLKNEKV